MIGPIGPWNPNQPYGKWPYAICHSSIVKSPVNSHIAVSQLLAVVTVVACEICDFHLTSQARKAAEEEEFELATAKAHGGELSDDDEEGPAGELSEDDSLQDQEVAPPVIPLRFNLGSLAESNLSTTTAKKKKPAPKKGSKKPGTGDAGAPEPADGDDVLETGGGGDETSSLELYNEIEARKDTQLRQVIKALDCTPSSVPVCLAGCFPDKVLFEKFKAGHQLKGVTWFVLFIYRYRSEMNRLVWRRVFLPAAINFIP